jgi:hypothetical protein
LFFTDIANIFNGHQKNLPVSCPGVSRWFVEVCLCMALSCTAFLLKKKKTKKEEEDKSLLFELLPL